MDRALGVKEISLLEYICTKIPKHAAVVAYLELRTLKIRLISFVVYKMRSLKQRVVKIFTDEADFRYRWVQQVIHFLQLVDWQACNDVGGCP